jgi:hypothetical protein
MTISTNQVGLLSSIALTPAMIAYFNAEKHGALAVVHGRCGDGIIARHGDQRRIVRRAGPIGGQ